MSSPGARHDRTAAIPANDAHELTSVSNGDPRQLQRLYETHLPIVYRFIYAKVGNREEAEDLTSQVFVKALRGFDAARSPHNVESWLFQVARTTIADHWRSFYRLRADSLDALLATGWETGAIPSAQPAASLEAQAHNILSHLSERYRDVLTYRFLLNYSIRETAERLGLSEANVKVLQFRALKAAAAVVTRAGDHHAATPPHRDAPNTS